MCVGAGLVHVLLCGGGSSSGAGSGIAARAVMGLALADVTGVVPLVPLLVALAVASLVASFTSWNFSMNCKKHIDEMEVQVSSETYK